MRPPGRDRVYFSLYLSSSPVLLVCASPLAAASTSGPSGTEGLTSPEGPDLRVFCLAEYVCSSSSVGSSACSTSLSRSAEGHFISFGRRRLLHKSSRKSIFGIFKYGKGAKEEEEENEKFNWEKQEMKAKQRRRKTAKVWQDMKENASNLCESQ